MGTLGIAVALRSKHAFEEAAWGVFEDLCRRYSEPHRAYHNLSHLEALFSLLDEQAFIICSYHMQYERNPKNTQPHSIPDAGA